MSVILYSMSPFSSTENPHSYQGQYTISANYSSSRAYHYVVWPKLCYRGICLLPKTNNSNCLIIEKKTYAVVRQCTAVLMTCLALLQHTCKRSFLTLLQNLLEYKKKQRKLRVRMLDGAVKTMFVDDSHAVAQLMITICTRIGE